MRIVLRVPVVLDPGELFRGVFSAKGQMTLRFVWFGICSLSEREMPVTAVAERLNVPSAYNVPAT